MRLLIPRFLVPKADGSMVDWNSKVNKHNAALWPPSFILADSGDLEENVVKWLSQPIGSYLLNGSPDEDYTKDNVYFIKTWQADIDVGQQFHNFQSHVDDQPYLGVRMVDTRNDGSFKQHWFIQFTCLHFGGRASPYLPSRHRQE